MCVRPLFVPVLFAYKVQLSQPRIDYGAVHDSDALEKCIGRATVQGRYCT